MLYKKDYEIKKYREVLKQGNVVREAFYIKRSVYWLLFVLPIFISDEEV